MGLGTIEIEILVHEHSYRPFVGEILAIGRQHIGPPGSKVMAILERHGVTPIRTDFEENVLDTHSAGKSSISDKSFFGAFSTATYLTADINPYEGAEFIFDICSEVPDELVGRFDLILDGGSLDNVFDPVRMVSNMGKMLKPGGRMFINAWSNGFPTAYVKITPDWIMDYCAVNEYADCKVYVSRHEQPGGDSSLGQSVELFHYDPLLETAAGPVFQGAFVGKAGLSSIYCIAEKGEASSNDRTAVQVHYRGKNTQPYLESAIRFHASPRPIFAIPGRAAPDISPVSDMQTVRPVALFGTPARYSGEFMILRKLEHLLAAQKLSEGRIDTNRAIFESAVNKMQHKLSTQVHDLHQQLSTQLYDTKLELMRFGPSPPASLVTRIFNRLMRVFRTVPSSSS